MPCASAASDFNPRAPCGARLFLRLLKPGEFCISTHAPLAGRDSRSIWLSQAARRFQPTRPLRGATAADWASQISSIFQPTRPLRGATDDDSSTARHGAISTHAPLAGRDGRRRGVDNAGNQISTHAPLAGRDCGRYRAGDGLHTKFQPTRPLRGATAKVYKSLCTFLR